MMAMETTQLELRSLDRQLRRMSNEQHHAMVRMNEVEDVMSSLVDNMNDMSVSLTAAWEEFASEGVGRSFDWESLQEEGKVMLDAYQAPVQPTFFWGRHISNDADDEEEEEEECSQERKCNKRRREK